MGRPPKGTEVMWARREKIAQAKTGIITLVLATNTDILVAAMAVARIFQLADVELGLSIIDAEQYLNPVVSTFDEEDDTLSNECDLDVAINNSVEGIAVSNTSACEIAETVEQEAEEYDSLADDEELNYADVIRSSKEYEREIIENIIAQLKDSIAANPENTDGMNLAREQSLADNQAHLDRLDSSTENESTITSGKSSAARARAKKAANKA